MRTVRQLIRALRDEDEEVRAEAADLLGELGPSAGAAIPALIHALGDEDLHVRCRAALALGRVGEGSGEAEAALSEALRDHEAEVRAAAARVLLGLRDDGLGGEVKEVLGEATLEAGGPDHQPLSEALAGQRERVRRAAARAIVEARMPPATGEIPGLPLEGVTLAGSLEDPDPLVRLAAARLLVVAGVRAEPALTAMLACLLEGSLTTRGLASRVLLDSVPLVRGRLAGLEQLLGGGDGGCRWAALVALARVGVPSETAADILIENLENFAGEDRAIAARALARVGRGNPAAIRTLRDLAVSERSLTDVVDAAVDGLMWAGSGTGLAVPAYIDILLDERNWCREEAANLIAAEERFLPGVALASDAVAKLIAMLACDRAARDFRHTAERVLLGTGTLPVEVIGALRGRFGGLAGRGSERGRFSELSPRAADLAVPALLELVRGAGPSPSTVVAAATALAEIRPEEAVTALLDRLASGEDYGPGQFDGDIDGSPAAIALGLLRAREAVPDLLLATTFRDEPTRVEAVRALGRILGDEAVPVLVGLLGDRPGGEPRTRGTRPADVLRAAAEALGALGPTGRDAAPALEGLLARGPDGPTGQAVAAALASIRGAGAGPPPAVGGPGEEPGRGGG